MTLAERLLNYVNDVLEGKILTCKKHKQAIQRFVNDLNQVENEDYPYYFDGNTLIDFYEWAKLFKHTKGVLANQPIELTDFQLFIVANIFCWKKKSNDLRRFRYVYIQLARKNAKSQLLSLISSYIAFLSDEQEEIYICGNNREQSKIVYDEILSQIKGAELLKGKYKDSYGKITHIRSGSIIQALSKEARKSGDGKNVSLAVIDEFHSHITDEIYEVMKSGMVARKQPLLVIISTAGFDLASPCFTEYEYVSKIIDPDNVTENDEYFVLICELDQEDDIKDEQNWIKANPIVATYEEGLKSLRGDLQIALDVPEKMTKFMTKNLNLWVQAKEHGYMDLSKWNKCSVDTLPNIQGKETYIGVDLSATLDLTSVAFLIPMEDQKFVCLGHSFMPEEMLMTKISNDKVPFDLWNRQGWLSLTEGSVVDYRYLEKYIMDMVSKYNLKPKGIYYDEWSAQDFANRMMDENYICVKVVQGMKTLAPATKKFRELVYQEKIIHENNPVINWAMGNCITKLDVNGNYMLDKAKARQRIDPVASIINAHVHAQYHFQNSDINSLVTDDYLKSLGW